MNHNDPQLSGSNQFEVSALDTGRHLVRRVARHCNPIRPGFATIARNFQFCLHIEQTRHIAAHVCGRGLYQEMLVWETAEQTMSGEAELEFARIWRPIPKVVFSRTLGFGGRPRAASHRRHCQ